MEDDQEREMWEWFYKGERILANISSEATASIDITSIGNTVSAVSSSKTSKSSSSSTSSGTGSGDSVEDGIHAINSCLALIRSLHIFSSNEDIDDIKTTHIILLLSEALLARLVMLQSPVMISNQVSSASASSSSSSSSSAGNGGFRMDVDKRKEQLLRAYNLNISYLKKLNELGVLDATLTTAYKAAMKSFENAQLMFDKSAQKEAKSVAESKGKMAAAQTTDPSAVRALKIERFKSQKNDEKLLQELHSKIQRANDVEDSGNAEEFTREASLLVLKNASRKALDEIDGILREFDMVYHMMQLEEQASRLGLSSPAALPSQQKPVGKGLSVTQIGPNHQIKRETFKDGVFKPSHRQPTMTIEEFGELEMKKANEMQEKQAAAKLAAKNYVDDNEYASIAPVHYQTLKEQGMEDNIKLVDKSTLKDRAWDDWKDDHTKGAGVTKRF